MEALTSRFLCSTGTMVAKENNYNYKRALDVITLLKADGLIFGGELMMLPFYYDKFPAVNSAVRSTGVPFPVIHCEKGVGTDLSNAAQLHSLGLYTDAEAVFEAVLILFRLNCAFGKSIGAKYIVFHLWSGKISDTFIEYNISKAKMLSDVASEYSLEILFETIPCTKYNPIENLRKLKNVLPDVSFLYDTRLSAFHNLEFEVIRSDDIFSCVKHVHVSDLLGKVGDFSSLRPILHPFDGKIDFYKIAEYIKEANYTGLFTLESPITVGEELDTQKIRNTFEKLITIF